MIIGVEQIAAVNVTVLMIIGLLILLPCQAGVQDDRRLAVIVMKDQTADDWLDTFDMFSIYEILPQIFELWALNTKQTSTPKKK